MSSPTLTWSGPSPDCKICGKEWTDGGPRWWRVVIDADGVEEANEWWHDRCGDVNGAVSDE